MGDCADWPHLSGDEILMLKKPLKVAMVGTTPSSRMLAPYMDEAWEIWACSPDNAGMLPRVNRWFEIHGDIGFPGAEPWEKPYIDWLNDNVFDRLYVHEARVGMFRISEAIPMDELVKMFGPYFFTSTAAWMAAMAIKEGAEEIALYGFDMSAKSEYAAQRPGLHHFLYLAEQRGIGISCPLESDVIRPPPLYGHSLITPMGRKLHVRGIELRGRLAQMDEKMAALKYERAFIEGALDDNDYQQSIWTGEREPELDQGHAMESPKVVNLKGE